MAFEFTIPHAFSVVSVRAHAPAAGGVYGISNSQEWILIGETDNIRERLYNTLIGLGTGIKAHAPTGFTYELCESTVRTDGTTGWSHKPAGHTIRSCLQSRIAWRTEEESLMDFMLAGFKEGAASGNIASIGCCRSQPGRII